MPKAAKPYKEAGAWCMRRRIRGEDLYVCGCENAKEAREEMEKKVKAISARHKPFGLGPANTTVAQAILDYGLQTLPFLKGAKQECGRINRYLRPAGLPTLRVVELDHQACEERTAEAAESDKPMGIRRQNTTGQVYFEVHTVEAGTARKIPQGLGTHRRTLAEKSAGSDLLRERLARRDMESVSRYHVQ